MDVIRSLLEGFIAWETPLSFLGGVGAHHLYVKYWRDRTRSVFEQNTDDTKD